MSFFGSLSSSFRGKSKNNEKVFETAAETAAPTTQSLELAPGSAGDIKLYDVPDKDAAFIMAIVADKMQKPINELRFKSIREVK